MLIPKLNSGCPKYYKSSNVLLLSLGVLGLLFATIYQHTLDGNHVKIIHVVAFCIHKNYILGLHGVNKQIYKSF